MSKPVGQFPRKADLPNPFHLCPKEDLHACSRTIGNLSSLGYWAAICPELTVDGKPGKSRPTTRKLHSVEDLKRQLHDEGAFQVSPNEMHWPVDIHCLARNMVILMQHGWPATFLILFDEVWKLIHQAGGLMAATTGNACNLDVLCWYVDPNHGDVGFSPHRDRQPDNAPATFRPGDGSPMYSTCWVPLTDACPENSCLYMVPRWADPGYDKGDDDEGPDPLTVALRSKESFQAIRAFPAEAGSAVVFSHRIIHWGSRGRKGYHTPRLAISWGCADDAYEPPYFSRQYLPYPPLDLRAALACGQMLLYHERFPMTMRQLSLYYKFFNLHADKFHESYRAKVAAEFVAATKELVAAAAPPRALASGGNGDATAVSNGGVHSYEKGLMADGKKGKNAKVDKKAKEGKSNDGDVGGVTVSQGQYEHAQPRRGTEVGKKRAMEDASGVAAVPRDSKAKGSAEALVEARGFKKARKVGVPNSSKDAAEVQATAAAAAAATAAAGGKVKAAAKKTEKTLMAKPKKVKEAVMSAEAPAADKDMLRSARQAGKEEKGMKKRKRAKEATAGHGAAPRVQPEAAKSNRASDGKAGDAEKLRGDGGDEDEGEEEEGPGWEGLLGGDGGDSEDVVMEDALDAMLEAKLLGREEGLEDDFDDFQDDM